MMQLVDETDIFPASPPSPPSPTRSAAPVPVSRRKRERGESTFPNVFLMPRSTTRYRAIFHDNVIFNEILLANGQTMQVPTKFELEDYASAREAYDAMLEKKEELAQEHVLIWRRMAQDDPTIRGLEMGPSDAAEATAGVAYWRPNPRNARYHPNRVVRGSAGTRGIRWRPCCVYKNSDGAYACTSSAQGNSRKKRLNDGKDAVATSALCLRHASVIARSSRSFQDSLEQEI